MTRRQMRKSSTILLSILIVSVVACMLFACNDTESQGKNLYTVNFDANDGSALVTQEVNPANITYLPKDRVGYDFVRWTMDKDGNEQIDASKFADGITLYAQWRVKTYKVSFYANGQPIKEVSVAHGNSAIAPTEDEVNTYIKEYIDKNKVFDGWDKTFDNVTSNLDVNAIIKDGKKETYTINFVNGDDVIATFNVNRGNNIPAPIATQNPTKDGFTFIGWADEQGEEYIEGLKAYTNQNFLAQWSLDAPTNPTLSGFDKNGNATITYGDSISIGATYAQIPSGVSYTYNWVVDGTNAGTDSTLTLDALKAGTHVVRCEVTASADGYSSAKNEGIARRIIVEKAVLSANIDEINIVYGENVATVTYSYSGFKFNDDATCVNTASVTPSTAYVAGANVGSYPISASGFEAENYSIDTANGTINVAKKTISTLSAINKSFTYSASQNASVTLDESNFEGLMKGHTLLVTLTANKKDVGTYTTANGTLTQTQLTITSGEADVSANYALSLNASIEITPAPIDYTLPDKTQLTFNNGEQGVALEMNSAYNVTYATNKEGEYTSKVPTFVHAGTHTVYFKIERENYKSVEASFNVVIDKAKLTIRPTSQNAVYGQSFTLDQSAFAISGESFGIEKSEFDVTITTNYTVGNSIGEYAINVTATHPDFDITTHNATLIVNRATLALSVANKTVEYGNAFEPTIQDYVSVESGLYEKDNLADLVTISTTYQAGEIGEAKIEVALKNKNGNYTLSANTGKVSIEKRALAINIDNKSITYGDSAPTYTHTLAKGEIFGEDMFDVTYKCTYAQGANAGTYTISADVAYDDNKYTLTVSNGTLTVNKKAMTITANDASITYGDALPTFTYTKSDDFVGETPIAKFDCAYAQGAHAGEYDVSVSMQDDNYAFTFNKGTLTVAKRNVTILYNDNNVAFVSNDKAHSVSVKDMTIQGAYGEDMFGGVLTTVGGGVGTYDKVGETLTFATALTITNKNSQNVLDCYNVTYQVSIVIKNIEIAHIVNGAGTFTYDGKAHTANVVADGATITYTQGGNKVDESALSFVNAGTYVVTFRLEQEGKTPYESTLTVKILPRETLVSALPQSTIYGEAFTLDQSKYTASNLADGDSLDVTLFTTYTVGSNKGEYAITAKVQEDANYNVTTQDSTLTVSAKTVVVTAQNAYVTYGDVAVMPTFTTDVEGAKQYVTLQSTYTQGDFSANPYAITIASNTDNYTYTLKEAYTLTVTKRKVTISLSMDKSEYVYGTDKMSATYTCTSGDFYGNDADRLAYMLDGAINIANIPSVQVHAGDHSVSATLGSYQDRYDLTVTSVTAKVVPAVVEVSVSKPADIIFGDDVPKIKVTYTLLYTDDVLSGTLSPVCDYPNTKAVGTYTLGATGLESADYTVKYVPTTLTVQKATITVKGTQLTIKYGESVDFAGYEQSALYTLSNNVYFGTAYNVVATPSTTYQVGCDVGAYPITYIVDEGVYPNFTFDVTDGTLTVQKADYTREQLDQMIANLDEIKGTYSYNLTLSAFESALSGTGFAWANPDSTLVTCDKNSVGYNATFVGDKNHNAYEGTLTIKITLAKAKYDLVLDGDLATDWTGSAIDYITLTKEHVKLTNNTDSDEKPLTVSLVGMSQMIDGGVYTVHVHVDETTNYLACEQDFAFKVKSVTYNSTTYTVEDALNLATSGTITLFGNAFVSSDVTLAKGVTFLLPSTADSSATVGKPTYGAGQGSYVDTNANYLELTLTLNNGTTLNVNGNIVIGGLLGREGPGVSGHTSGKYSQIVNNGAINVNNGASLDVRGYIKGTGTAYMHSGSTSYAPFVVIDFQGGTYTVNAYTIKNISPFSQYEMPNIQCAHYLYAGQNLVAYVELYADGKPNNSSLTIIGSGGALENSDGYVYKTYNRETRKTTLEVVGTTKFNSLKLDYAGVTADLAKVAFPIPWMYDITLGDGTTASSLSLSNDCKLMTGASFTIAQNATLTLDGTAVVYSSYENSFSLIGVPYPTKDAAKFVVNGTFEVKKGSLLSKNKFGGLIQSTTSGAKVVIASSYCETSASTKEATSSNGLASIETTTVKENARFADGTTLSTGKTYTFDGTSWTVA